jgi:ABC-type glutathione transport system ATPase component
MLQGVSGAGKTTLLDVLASRTTMGVIGGDMLVDGRQRDESFQRQTGYCMQQDIHLDTSTVREALEFSALLRQPPEYGREERLAYVDHVIRLLDMEEYADAVVGIPGSGLNVERKYSYAYSYAPASFANLPQNESASPSASSSPPVPNCCCSSMNPLPVSTVRLRGPSAI